VTEASRAADHMKRIAGEYGGRAAVWRYDPIVSTTLTDTRFHVANFERLAAMLEGTTDEVIVSFLQIYRKTQRNMDAAARLFKFAWRDPPEEEKCALLGKLAPIARARGMKLTVCTQPELLEEGVTEEARCIDAIRLSEVAGRAIGAKLKGNREGCGCYYARDIGEYDTCPHGCVYCYAVGTRALAQRSHRAHDPHGEFLFTSSAKR